MRSTRVLGVGSGGPEQQGRSRANELGWCGREWKKRTECGGGDKVVVGMRVAGRIGKEQGVGVWEGGGSFLNTHNRGYIIYLTIYQEGRQGGKKSQVNTSITQGRKLRISFRVSRGKENFTQKKPKSIWNQWRRTNSLSSAQFFFPDCVGCVFFDFDQQNLPFILKKESRLLIKINKMIPVTFENFLLRIKTISSGSSNFPSAGVGHSFFCLVLTQESLTAPFFNIMIQIKFYILSLFHNIQVHHDDTISFFFFLFFHHFLVFQVNFLVLNFHKTSYISGGHFLCNPHSKRQNWSGETQKNAPDRLLGLPGPKFGLHFWGLQIHGRVANPASFDLHIFFLPFICLIPQPLKSSCSLAEELKTNQKCHLCVSNFCTVKRQTKYYIHCAEGLLKSEINLCHPPLGINSTQSDQLHTPETPNTRLGDMYKWREVAGKYLIRLTQPEVMVLQKIILRNMGRLQGRSFRDITSIPGEIDREKGVPLLKLVGEYSLSQRRHLLYSRGPLKLLVWFIVHLVYFNSFYVPMTSCCIVCSTKACLQDYCNLTVYFSASFLARFELFIDYVFMVHKDITILQSFGYSGFSDPPCLNVPAQWYMHLLNGLTQGSYTSYSLLLNPSSTFSRFFNINILQDQHGSHKQDRLMYSNDHPTPLHQIKHDIILLSSIHVHLSLLPQSQLSLILCCLFSSSYSLIFVCLLSKSLISSQISFPLSLLLNSP
ncbi:hypothetical protein VP01_2087g4 [Puccinia sorghi]|uniref:Uncharacterized protein n=1 Tax=Puccinia sorghi TaxID=27349 RepID=A0A0L6VC66_9BASI|nr:hypothetical protein VP01_2087g4 [Puccinia sorghi]